MKRWIRERMQETDKILRELKIASLSELSSRPLLAHFGKLSKKYGGISCFVPKSNLVLDGKSIMMSLGDTPIYLNVHIGKKSKRVGPFIDGDILVVKLIEYRLGKGWVASYQVRRDYDLLPTGFELRQWEGMLDVEIVR